MANVLYRNFLTSKARLAGGISIASIISHIEHVSSKRICSLSNRSCFQVLYAVKEYACTAIDVVARRTRLGFLNVQAAEEALPRIVELMARELKWSEQKKKVNPTDQNIVTFMS